MNFEKEARKTARKKIKVEFTIKQFELLGIMIDAANGDVDNGCEWVQGLKPQIEQLFKRRMNGKLASRKDG